MIGGGSASSADSEELDFGSDTEDAGSTGTGVGAAPRGISARPTSPSPAPTEAGKPERVTRAEALAAFYAEADDADFEARRAQEPWIDPPGPEAFHGILGEIARTCEPHTEADPIGLLATLLVMFGSACGGAREFYMGSQQRSNLAMLLVGETGSGRKGTSLSVVRQVIEMADRGLLDLELPGVASGEAITGHLSRQKAAAEKRGDAPEERVLIVEPEFGRLLTIMNREGSTLSSVFRQAWDGYTLGYARAREGERVAKHHVSLLGHITPVELRQKLTGADAANGFANRLLFVAVRSQRLVPFPKSPAEHARTLAMHLRDRIRAAQVPAELALDRAARDRWETFYRAFRAEPRLGLAGAVTGRHEAQVQRLALVYAMADGSDVIALPHLEAAIAFAEYARRSVVWALGDSTGSRDADALRDLLAQSPSGEVTWEEARRELNTRKPGEMTDAVDILVAAGIAHVVTAPREDGRPGRPKRLIRANSANPAKGAGARARQNGG